MRRVRQSLLEQAVQVEKEAEYYVGVHYMLCEP